MPTCTGRPLLTEERRQAGTLCPWRWWRKGTGVFGGSGFGRETGVGGSASEGDNVGWEMGVAGAGSKGEGVGGGAGDVRRRSRWRVVEEPDERSSTRSAEVMQLNGRDGSAEGRGGVGSLQSSEWSLSETPGSEDDIYVTTGTKVIERHVTQAPCPCHCTSIPHPNTPNPQPTECTPDPARTTVDHHPDFCHQNLESVVSPFKSPPKNT
jgi:hypothetical protein